VKSSTPEFPEWRVILPDGSVVDQEGGRSPYEHLSQPGTIIAIRRGGELIVVAPSSRSRIDWITTVDAKDGADPVRRVGAGIVTDGGPVRLWAAPTGPLVLTDGPIEQAVIALDRLREGGGA